MFTKVLI